MADTTTANYGFVKPENGASSDTWGVKGNANLDDIDSDLKTVEDKADAAQADADTALTGADASAKKASNLTDLTDKPAARTALGLRGAALLNITVSGATPSGGTPQAGDIWVQV